MASQVRSQLAAFAEPARRRSRWSRGALGVAALWLGCAAADTYWTRGDASAAEFRKVSRVCNEKAQLRVFEEARERGCGPDGACEGRRAQTPFPEQTEKNRQERRRSYLYGECLEARGWERNTDGRGYKGR